jgi:hypothetical protein
MATYIVAQLDVKNTDWQKESLNLSEFVDG